MNGLLLIDKPKGITSFDVVARLRRLLGTRRIGHTGTLDPMATGLMAVLVGSATRLSPYVTATEKAYLATVALGETTNTYDAEGTVTASCQPELLSRIDVETVERTLALFRGEITQTPPSFSAIKVKGERLYERARRGESVEAPARQVVIHALRLIDFACPQIRLEVQCSKGTYIRSLAHDIGESLCVGAHLSFLRRTQVGAFRIEDTLTLEEIEEVEPSSRAELLKPMVQAVCHLPSVVLNSENSQHVAHGRRFRVESDVNGTVAGLDPSGKLLAIIELGGDGVGRVLRGLPTG